jgi:chemotaxis protein MotB
MIGNSRAQRFFRTWLGSSLATLVGIGLAALPAQAAQLSDPTSTQQSSAPAAGAQPPAATSQTPSAGEGSPDWLNELHESLQAARVRIEELSKAAEAVATTGQHKLAALEQENQRLRAELEAAQAERGALDTAKQAAAAHEAELSKLQGRVRELEGSSAQASAQAARLREQMAASEQRIAAADSARAQSDAQLSQMRDRLQLAEQEKAQTDADLARVQGELASVKKQLAAAGQERAQLEQRAAAAESERDDLRVRLADASARLGTTESAKAQLASEVAKLREATSMAADNAHQNLIALESRIKDLNQTLAALEPAAGPAPTAEPSAPAAGKQAARETTTAAAPVAPVATAASATAASRTPEPTGTEAEPEQVETANATPPGDEAGAHLDQRSVLGGVPAVLSLADLPAERRQHVRHLLADLHSGMDERGMITTVPGELLFSVGGDEVQAGAYDTLAKVADLINMYGNRQILIVGHTDAEGGTLDNLKLSERRAESVKRFLVDNFALPPGRLSTEGLGEASPIASNATPDGRRANRRVEVVVLN